MEDKDFYKELQTTLRSYDMKLWAIPGVFFSVFILSLSKLNLNFIATVYNGIKIEDFKLSVKNQNYLVWLGRITEKKGLIEAIRASKKAKLRLKIAAKVDKNNLSAIKKGFVNLEKHIANLQKFKVPVVVTLNAFVTDSREEIEFIKTASEKLGADFAVSNVWEKGGQGGIDLAKQIISTLESKKSDFKVLYDEKLSIPKK